MFRILAFFRPWKTKIIVLIDRKSGSDFHQQTAAKNLQGTRVVDIQPFAQGLEEYLFFKPGKYE